MKRAAEDEGQEETKKAKAPNVPASAPSSGQADDAISAHSMNLRDLLKAQGSEDQYDVIMSYIMDDDPLVHFFWRHSLGDFVDAIRVAQAQAQHGDALPACPFVLPPVLTVESFKASLLDYAHVEGARARIDNGCLPGTTAQCMRVASKLRHLDLHPWTLGVIAAGGANALPIATVYVNRPRADALDLATEPYPNSLFGPPPQ